MNKLLLAIGAIALLGVAAVPVSAGQPSAKTSVITVPLTLVDEITSGENTDPDPVTSVVMATQLKTGNADLLISVSVECGVFLRRLAKSKKANKAMKRADANVVLVVKVDGDEAAPGPVTFCDQEATLSASLSGTLSTDEEVELVAEIIGDEVGDEDGICEEGEACLEDVTDEIGDNDGVCEVIGDELGSETDPIMDEDEVCETITLFGTCLILNEDTGQILVDEDCLSESEIELVLSSLNANAFFFVKANVGPGVHHITVEATIDLGGSSFGAVEDGLFEAKALVGKGTVVVEQVRLVKDLDGICDGTEEDPDCV